MTHARLAVAALTVLGLALRLWYCEQSLFGDELFTYENATRDSFADMMDGVYDVEYTPPLYFVLAWLAATIGGDGELAIRMPAVLFGTATIPLVYALARRAGGTAAGLGAAAVFAITPFALFFGSEARSYAAAGFFVALAALALLQALESDRRRHWVVLAVALAGVMLSHYTAIAAIVCLGLWAVLTRRDRLRPLVLAYAAAGAAFLVWVPFAPTFAAPDVVGIFNPFTLRSAVASVARSLFGVSYAIPLADVPGRVPAAALSAVALAGAAGVALLARREGPRAALRSPLGLLAVLALGMPLALIAYSAVSTDVFIARSLFPTAPAVYAALAVGVAALPRPAALACAAIALAGLVAGAIAAAGPDGRRPQYEEAARFVEASTRPGDPVLDAEVFPELAPRDALEIHLEPARRVTEIDEDPAGVRRALASAPRIAVTGMPDVRGREAFAAPPAAGLELVRSRVFRGSVDIRVAIYARP